MKFAAYNLAVCATALLPLSAAAETRSTDAASAETRQAAQALAARFAGNAEPAADKFAAAASQDAVPLAASAVTGGVHASSLIAGLAQAARAAGEQAAQNRATPTRKKSKTVTRTKRKAPTKATVATTKRKTPPPQDVATSNDPPTIGMRPQEDADKSIPVDFSSAITKIFTPSQWSVFGGGEKQPAAAAYTD